MGQKTEKLKSVIIYIVLSHYPPSGNVHVILLKFKMATTKRFFKYSGDPEIGPPMGLTESGPFLELVRFVKPANYEWRDTSQSVYR